MWSWRIFLAFIIWINRGYPFAIIEKNTCWKYFIPATKKLMRYEIDIGFYFYVLAVDSNQAYFCFAREEDFLAVIYGPVLMCTQKLWWSFLLLRLYLSVDQTCCKYSSFYCKHRNLVVFLTVSSSLHYKLANFD